MAFSDNTTLKEVAISSGNTTSSVVVIDGLTMCLLKIPSSFTGSTISFQVSLDGGSTYGALYDSTNTLVSITVATGRVYALDPSTFASVRNFKIVSGSSEGADRIIQAVCRPV